MSLSASAENLSSEGQVSESTLIADDADSHAWLTALLAAATPVFSIFGLFVLCTHLYRFLHGESMLRGGIMFYQRTLRSVSNSPASWNNSMFRVTSV